MALRTLLFAAILLVGVAAPRAQAQLGGLGGLLDLIQINGTVFCSTGLNTSTATTPVFPNASVQLQCGNNVVSNATTNGAGVFTILLDPITTPLSSLLNNSKLVVKTPLSTCNASLPAVGGILQSTLQLLSSTVQGLIGIVNVVPTGFSLLRSLT